MASEKSTAHTADKLSAFLKEKFGDQPMTRAQVTTATIEFDRLINPAPKVNVLMAVTKDEPNRVDIAISRQFSPNRGQ